MGMVNGKELVLNGYTERVEIETLWPQSAYDRVTLTVRVESTEELRELEHVANDGPAFGELRVGVRIFLPEQEPDAEQPSSPEREVMYFKGMLQRSEADLDKMRRERDAARDALQNIRGWITRGLAYERAATPVRLLDQAVLRGRERGRRQRERADNPRMGPTEDD